MVPLESLFFGRVKNPASLESLERTPQATKGWHWVTASPSSAGQNKDIEEGEPALYLPRLPWGGKDRCLEWQSAGQVHSGVRGRASQAAERRISSYLQGQRAGQLACHTEFEIDTGVGKSCVLFNGLKPENWL